MSLINFLNPKLKPSVECDSVWSHGYSCTNLISDDANLLAHGFMGFAATKPPVELIFDFPKAIEVKVIKLWNRMNGLRSTAFEIYGKTEGTWERVSSVRDLHKDIDIVTFCYQSDFSSRNHIDQATVLGQSVCVFFYKGAQKFLSNTNCIKIVIRATSKCPVVLKKAQVWGLPSRSLEKADRELIKTIWNEITDPYGQQQQQQNSGQRSPTRCAPELNEHSTLQIPEEFLDSITWELMVFPTVLPSGKVVDQSTIDKHSEQEANWGRLPSDPFTGLEFASDRKAILNLALKARIEKFLMENSEHFKTVPRSLGSSRVRRSKNRHASQFASICQSHTYATPGSYSSITAALSKSSKLRRETTATATLATECVVPPKRLKLSETLRTYQTELPLPLYTSTSTQTSVTATASYSTSSAVADTTTDIDQALQQTLLKITRYTIPPTKPNVACCVNCKSEEFAYEIRTCKHLVCRNCIANLTDMQMCSCKMSFRNADVERFHKW